MHHSDRTHIDAVKLHELIKLVRKNETVFCKDQLMISVMNTQYMQYFNLEK